METDDATLGTRIKQQPPGVFSGPKPEALRACKILLIDDEETNLLLLERFLTRAGFDNFISTTDSREAAALCVAFQPDLILTDWLMPDVDGCEVIKQLRALTATDDYLPIVVLTADVTSETKTRALAAGATDFLTKPFDQIEVQLRLQNLLGARLSHLIIQAQNATLEKSVHQRTVELERALVQLQRTQKQIIQQERLAALGTMACGIAHDFNNALSIITGFGELLLLDAEEGLTSEKATPLINTILGASEDAATIVRRLQQFYRPDEEIIEEQRVPVDLNKLVEQAVSLTQPRWQTEALANGCTIEVTADYGGIPSIMGEAAELREALTNIIFNAVDAMPRGGAITLHTSAMDGVVVLKITDTGTGMSEEVRQRCIEPFFTTKGKRGTGLGLAMVFGIVNRHGGSMDVESEPGEGTIFTLRLPTAGAESVTMRDESQTPHRPLRILVVDDQPILSHLVCEYLRDDHHTVETALNATEALEKFRSIPFDLVITDHVMDETTGEQIAIMIKRINPASPVILLTGCADDFAADEQHPQAVNLVLGKPASRVELREAFAKVMRGG